jgi:hypothetical protein
MVEPDVQARIARAIGMRVDDAVFLAAKTLIEASSATRLNRRRSPMIDISGLTRRTPMYARKTGRARTRNRG